MTHKCNHRALVRDVERFTREDGMSRGKKMGLVHHEDGGRADSH